MSNNNLFSIVKIGNEYCLRNAYQKSDDGKLHLLYGDSETAQNDIKCCHRCIYRKGSFCELCEKLVSQNSKGNHFAIKQSFIVRCDAYEPIKALTYIGCKEDMIQFIEKVQNFFPCVEDYEMYFGFERKWNEETGEILETIREYYDRGGEFDCIPDKYPCVIYFGLADVNANSPNVEWLEWLEL